MAAADFDAAPGMIAYLVFAEVPAARIWIGGAIIAASSVYITLREAKLRREAQAAPTTSAQA